MAKPTDDIGERQRTQCPKCYRTKSDASNCTIINCPYFPIETLSVTHPSHVNQPGPGSVSARLEKFEKAVELAVAHLDEGHPYQKEGSYVYDVQSVNYAHGILRRLLEQSK